MKGYAINTKVKWNWGKGSAEGEIRSRFTDEVTKTLKGTKVSRNATSASPAYLIEQDDGDEVLKSHSEVEKVN